MIADGPHTKNLEKQSNSLDAVNFLGRQEHFEIIKYLSASDIFTLPSINNPNDREGTPTVIMEAMAAGLSIVATKVGGNSYLVKEGINGFLVEDKNSDELAGAMIKLTDNPEIREQMKIKNLEDIKQKDWPIIAKEITDVYPK